MKTTFVRKCMCMITALLLVLSVFAVSSSAGESTLNNTIKKIATVDAVDNDSATDGLEFDYGYMTTVNAVQNPDGTYCICLIMADGSIRIMELNADFSVRTTVNVAPQLECFAAFCKGTDGTYYVLFNQPLKVSTRNQTSLRLVNIGADSSVLRTLDMSGMASGSWLGIGNLNCGNNAMAANDNYLTGFIGRDMFPVVNNVLQEGGNVHQASYVFGVELDSFTLVEGLTSNDIPYASHSFHQTILKDGNDFLYTERCDSLPSRSHILTKMSGGLEWKKLYQQYSFEFKSQPVPEGMADNNTYGQLGGVLKCGDKYMLAGTYQNTTQETEQSSANVFVQLFDRVTLTPQKEKYLTSYSDKAGDQDGIDTAVNPKLVSVSDSYVAIPYMLTNYTKKTNEIHVILADGSGELIWDKAVKYNSDNPVLPKYGQVFYDSAKDSIVWFTVVNRKLIANSIELGVKDETVTTSAADIIETTTVQEETTLQEVTTLQEETTTETVVTTKAETTTQAPTIPVFTTEPVPETQTTTQVQQPVEQEPSFWQKIVDFFMSIYNFFVSLFT